MGEKHGRYGFRLQFDLTGRLNQRLIVQGRKKQQIRTPLTIGKVRLDLIRIGKMPETSQKGVKVNATRLPLLEIDHEQSGQLDRLVAANDDRQPSKPDRFGLRRGTARRYQAAQTTKFGGAQRAVAATRQQMLTKGFRQRLNANVANGLAIASCGCPEIRQRLLIGSDRIFDRLRNGIRAALRLPVGQHPPTRIQI
ncbi:hypothetical protein, partial [Pseudomonas viridiflava]|uniref:hypothetical protein n=1 Tax=Pseudomonas viridiflava TaxID=33069 RepID=UPI00197F2F2E